MKQLIYISLLIAGVSFNYGCKKDPVRGCTNPMAENYDPTATEDSGNCIIKGCTNPLAENFNPNANQDDGNCIIKGCTDPTALNFNPMATVNEGCLYKKDLFIGDWNATATCENPLLQQIFGAGGFQFKIIEISGQKDKVLVDFNAGPLELDPAEGMIDASNRLRSVRNIDGLEVDILGTGTPQKLRISTILELVRLANMEVLEGVLRLKVEAEVFAGVYVPIVEDDCTVRATK